MTSLSHRQAIQKAISSLSSGCGGLTDTDLPELPLRSEAGQFRCRRRNSARHADHSASLFRRPKNGAHSSTEVCSAGRSRCGPLRVAVGRWVAGPRTPIYDNVFIRGRRPFSRFSAALIAVLFPSAELIGEAPLFAGIPGGHSVGVLSRRNFK